MSNNASCLPVRRRDDLFTTAVLYYLSTLLILGGVEFGYHFVTLYPKHPDSRTRTDELSCLANWDGRWYERISSQGYTYDPERMSSVAFFPLYPLLAGAIIRVTGLRSTWALLIVSHTALISAYYAFLRYMRVRTDKPMSEEQIQNSLLALIFFPMTFFFRMTYTESLFLLLVIGTLWSIRSNTPLIITALLIGLATATRPVGVALGPVFVWHLWKRSPSMPGFLGRCCLSGPACLLGLATYMVYLQWAFDDPLAFSHTQTHWLMRRDITSWGDRLWCLLTFQPITDNFNPERLAYWGNSRNGPLEWLNIRILNVLFFCGTGAGIALGAWKRWLTRDEVIVSVCLLGFPYVTTGVGQGLTSAARYAAVVFPIYIVLGRLLTAGGRQATALALGVMMMFLFVYTSLFASWYWYF